MVVFFPFSAIHSRGVDNHSHMTRNFLWDEDENKWLVTIRHTAAYSSK